MKNLFLGLESLAAGNGGVSRVARLVARVVGEEAAAGRLRADGAVLRDAAVADDFGVPVRAAGRSRLRYIADLNRALFAHDHFVYDHIGLARAHNLLPVPRRPYLTFILGFEFWENARPVHLRAARRAHTLLTITAYTRDRAERTHGGFARAKVCWLATEADEPLAAPRRADGPPRVLILGRIDQFHYKGHAELIACWPQVVRAVPDAVLTIVGDGPGAARYRRMAAALPCADRIEFRGFVPEDKMEDVWSETTVLAMPSRGEGFGLVYIEAMRAGVPVIASVHDAAPEVNLDGQTGYNVNLDRPDELPERVIHLLRDRDHAECLGRNGLARWREHFRYSAFRDRFRRHLHEFLDS